MSRSFHDFTITCGTSEFPVSYHLVAAQSLLFQRPWVGALKDRKYETKTPAPREAFEAFINCLYRLHLDLDYVVSQITWENYPFIVRLSSEFECPGMMEALDKFVERCQHAKVGDVEQTVEHLRQAILENSNGELCAHLEKILAENLEVAMQVIGRMRLGDIPIPCLYRIVSRDEMIPRGVSKSAFVADFIISKLAASETSVDVCCLLDHVDIKQLSVDRFRQLYSFRQVQEWYGTRAQLGVIADIMGSVDAAEARLREEVNEAIQVQTQVLEDQSRQLSCNVEELQSLYRRVSEELTELTRAHSNLHMHVTQLDDGLALVAARDSEAGPNRMLADKIDFLMTRVSMRPFHYPHRSGAEFNGIVMALVRSSEAKHEPLEHYVSVSGTVPSQNVPAVLSFADMSCSTFHGTSENKPFFFLNFHHRLVNVHAYTLRSYNGPANASHMKSWVVEACRYDNSWIEIDTQNNCTHLNATNQSKTFTVNLQSVEAHAIRVRMTGPTWSGDFDLNCSGFEIYGVLLANNQ